MNHGHIKLPPTKLLSDSCIERRKLNDSDWINYIFFGLLKYIKVVDKQSILRIINNPKIKNENAISNNIYRWLINDRKFNSFEFIVNREPRTDGDQEGFIDLKFQHSQWDNGNKHFSFEAKNLDGSSILINEYVYTNKKIKGVYVENGGVFRFMTGKYAHNMDFGGMLGYVIKKCDNNIINVLAEKIEEVYSNNATGQLLGEIEKDSIIGNVNTFNTIHKRCAPCSASKFTLYHIILDFVN